MITTEVLDIDAPIWNLDRLKSTKMMDNTLDNTHTDLVVPKLIDLEDTSSDNVTKLGSLGSSI